MPRHIMPSRLHRLPERSTSRAGSRCIVRSPMTETAPDSGNTMTSAEMNIELAMRRTGTAFQRTRMAADRTLMGVIRTFPFAHHLRHQFFNELEDSGPVHAESGFPASLVLIFVPIAPLAVPVEVLFGKL